MTGKDHAFLALLALLAVFVWVRDLTWTSSAGDALPILAGLPLFVWLGWPWRFQTTPFRLPGFAIALSVAALVAGIVTELTFLLALGWTGLLWSWLRSRLQPDLLPAARRLLILPLLAFPWIMLDCQWVGWSFRLSAAWTVGRLF